MFLYLCFSLFCSGQEHGEPVKKKQRVERAIEIIPRKHADLDSVQNVGTSSEYGKDFFFKNIGVGNNSLSAQQTAVASATPIQSVVADSSLITGILKGLADYHDQYLEGKNPLLVACDFFKSDDKDHSCGTVYMGLFVSGSKQFAMDQKTCQGVDSATKTFQQFHNPKVISDFVKERESHGVYYKTPCFPIDGNSVPPISSGDLCAEEGQSRLSNKEAVSLRFAQHVLQGPLCKSLFEHDGQNRAETGCFQRSFNDCFAHSEQAWLSFLENPRPGHICFSNSFDIREASNFVITLYSYNDICRYCRGTFSFLSENIHRYLINLLEKLPDLMNTYWKRVAVKEMICMPNSSKESDDPQRKCRYFLDRDRLDTLKLEAIHALSFCPIDDTLRVVRGR